MIRITCLSLLRAPLRVAVPVFAACMLLSAVSAATPDVESYRLTPAAFDKYQRATDSMYDYINRHPELQSEFDDVEDEETDGVAEMAAALERRAPGLRKAMESSGMSLEEYFTFSLALAGSAFAVAMEDHMGSIDEDTLDAAQRENIAFLRANRARLDTFFAEMQRKYPTLFADPDDDEGDFEYEEEDWDDAEEE